MDSTGVVAANDVDFLKSRRLLYVTALPDDIASKIRHGMPPTPENMNQKHEKHEPPMNQKRLDQSTEWVYDEQAFPIWNSSFEKADRTNMIRDDLWAGRSIAILLSVLVGMGLVLSLLTVAFVANWR